MCLALVAVVTSAASGCGGRSEGDDVRATLRSFWVATATGDAATACSLLTGKLRRQVAADHDAPSCESAYAATWAELQPGRDEIARATAKAEKADYVIEIDANQASATVRSEQSEARLVKVEGEWYIAAID
jgi:hypothetical protein